MKAANPMIAASTMLVGLLCLSWLPVSATVGQQGEEAPLPTGDKMMWVPASNSTALCNDFTRAGFFIRNTASNNWVVFLEGGGLCYNTDTCNRRFFVNKVRLLFLKVYLFHNLLIPMIQCAIVVNKIYNKCGIGDYDSL